MDSPYKKNYTIFRWMLPIVGAFRFTRDGALRLKIIRNEVKIAQFHTISSLQAIVDVNTLIFNSIESNIPICAHIQIIHNDTYYT